MQTKIIADPEVGFDGGYRVLVDGEVVGTLRKEDRTGNTHQNFGASITGWEAWTGATQFSTRQTKVGGLHRTRKDALAELLAEVVA